MAEIGWLALQDIWEYCPTTSFAKVLSKITHMENNENKLNKIGLLQNPIGIGTRLCTTSM